MQIELTYTLNPVRYRSRLSELSQKTNQFNTGLRRLSELEVAKQLQTPNRYTIGIALRDRFSDSGVVGALFTHADRDELFVDEMCISCRALGRDIENLMVSIALAPIIEKCALRRVAFWFREGPRNSPARTWLKDFTGANEVPSEKFTPVEWEEVARRTDFVDPPITVHWETSE